MARTYSRNTKSRPSRLSKSPNQINLVSARSRSNVEVNRLSRNHSADTYAKERKRRANRKRLLVILSVSVTSLLIAAVAVLAVWAFGITDRLGKWNNQKIDFSSGLYKDALEPVKPGDSFWMLLIGTDEYSEPGYPRADTIILARVEPANKRVALVSMPRDLYVNIPGYGMDKINAAYSYGEQEKEGSGPALLIKTVSKYAEVDIAYFAQVNFYGLIDLVDGLGGVEIDVPVDIVGDIDAGGIDIYQGLQRLSGEEVLVFCRSRDFYISDFQRQANQRTFLQALAKQVLSSDLAKMTATIDRLPDLAFTNMKFKDITDLATTFRGIPETAIHTYYAPISDMPYIDGISYVVADSYSFNKLISDLQAGNFPPPQDDIYAGIVPDNYVANNEAAKDMSGGLQAAFVPNDFVVDVRNGCGKPGAARSISDMLSIVGYKDGEIANTPANVYVTSLIIYDKPEHREVAEDIRQRMGFGRVLAANGAYVFSGDILVIVGEDFTK